MDRLSPDLRILLGLEPASKDPLLLGRMRGVVAHNERRQRETDQELENQKRGDYDPVFQEVRDDLQPSIRVREPKKRATPNAPPRPKPVSENPDPTRLHPVLREYSRFERGAPASGSRRSPASRLWIIRSVPFSIGYEADANAI